MLSALNFKFSNHWFELHLINKVFLHIYSLFKTRYFPQEFDLWFDLLLFLKIEKLIEKDLKIFLQFLVKVSKWAKLFAYAFLYALLLFCSKVWFLLLKHHSFDQEMKFCLQIRFLICLIHSKCFEGFGSMLLKIKAEFIVHLVQCL